MIQSHRPLWLTLFFFQLLGLFVHSTPDPFPTLLSSALSKQHTVFGNPASFTSSQNAYGNTSLLSLELDSSQSLDSFLWGTQNKDIGFGYSYQRSAKLHGLHLNFPQGQFSSFGIGMNLNYLLSNKEDARMRDWYSHLGLYWEPTSFLQLASTWNNFWSTLPHQQESRIYAFGLKPITMWTLSYQAQHNTRHIDFHKLYNHSIHRGSTPSWGHSVSSSIEPFPGFFLSGKYNFAKHTNSWKTNWGLSAWFYSSSHQLWGAQYRSKSKKTQFTLQSHHKKKPKWNDAFSKKYQTKYAVLNLNKTIVDGVYTPAWYSLESTAQSSKVGHIQVLQQIRNIIQTPGLEHLWIRIGRTQCSYAVAEEIVRELQKAPESIQITAYMESTSRLQYFIASTADKIIMPPTSYFDLQSMSAEVTMYKGLMDKLGIQAQFIRRGKYKSFPEAFTREQISPEYESNLRSLLENRWEDYLQDISHNRSMEYVNTKEILTTPNLMVSHALEIGLLDSLTYESDLEDFFQRPGFSLQNHASLVQDRWGEAPKVAVLQIQGAITSGSSSTGRLFSGMTTGSESTVQLIRSLHRDPSVQGLILRINSPGGSAVASDIIWEELQRFKDSGRPIVATLGGTCASGGYYIATAADKIITNKKSTVGSIGIFGGKYVLKGLYDKLGIRKDILTTTPHGDSRSDYRPWDSQEVKVIQEYMDTFYQEFIDRVQTSRGFTTSQTDSVAEGRIFTGAQAIQNNLADKEGGFLEAIQEIKVLLDISPSTPVEWYTLSLNPSIQFQQQWSTFLKSFQSLQLLRTLWNPLETSQQLASQIEKWSRTPLPTQEFIWAISPEAEVLFEHSR